MNDYERQMTIENVGFHIMKNNDCYIEDVEYLAMDIERLLDLKGDYKQFLIEQVNLTIKDLDLEQLQDISDLCYLKPNYQKAMLEIYDLLSDLFADIEE